MLSLDDRREDTALVEFKCANTGVRHESFLRQLQTECPDMNPPFGSRHDVYNMEADALDHYRQLAANGIRIIVVAYRTWHGDIPLRAQYAENIAVCNIRNPNQGRSNRGSGTFIANTNFASLVSVPDFFADADGYALEREGLMAIEQAVMKAFRRRP